MRVLFVGYCYRDKGVFDIVEGCHLACSRGLEIDLTFIGQEHGEFSEYLDSRLPCENLSIHRLGKQSREVVLRLMGQSDIFLFPTYHKGEGHPNVINEAMAHAVPLIVTDCGAIGEILDTETAYFVAPLSPIQIADALGHVDANREEARRRANRARDRLISRYAASHLLARLRQTYVDLAASEGRQAIDSVGKLG